MKESVFVTNDYSENVENKHFSVAPEHDSGYITNNPESNSENSVETYMDGTCLRTVNTACVYISEDALLEKPCSTECNNKLNNDKDFSHLFYMNKNGMNEKDSSYGSIVEASVSTIESSFSGLDTTCDHLEENSSTSVFVIDPIRAQINDDELCKEVAIEKGECYNEIFTMKTPRKSPPKPVNPNISPDLFADEEDQTKHEKSLNPMEVPQIKKISIGNPQVLKNDKKLLRNVQESLMGVSPSISRTKLQISVEDMLEKIKTNKHLFLTRAEKNKTHTITNADNLNNPPSPNKRSLLISHTESEVTTSSWPEVIALRYHGLMYNRDKTSEDFEELCNKYALRYIGAETESTCSFVSSARSSPSKKMCQSRSNGMKFAEKHLSHLARRRITFSSLTLQSQSKPVHVESRKPISHLKKLNKSPRKGTPKKTPRKSAKKKTPLSSTKKYRFSNRLNSNSEMESSSRPSTTKRALFQSPEHGQGPSSSSLYMKYPRRALFASPSKAEIVANVGRTETKTKRTPKKQLFSSPSKRELSSLSGVRRTPNKYSFSIANMSENIKKRKRNDSIEDWHSNKFPRSTSADIQSSREDEMRRKNMYMRRCNSTVEVETLPAVSCDLTDAHKQKLLWAVSESLRTQKISRSHPKFKEYASTLARVIRRLLPDLLCTRNGTRHPGSTSQRMLKIARQCVYQVIKENSVDEIVANIISNKVNVIANEGAVQGNAQKHFELHSVNIKDKENVNTDNDSSDKELLRIRRNINFEEKGNLNIR